MRKPRCSKKPPVFSRNQKHFGEHELASGNAGSEVFLHSFFVIDSKGYFVGWNDSFQQEEAVRPGRRKGSINVIDKLIYPADQPLIKEKLLNVLKKGFQETAEARVIFQGEQELRWFMMTGRKITIKERPFVICMILDITARKLEEDRLAHTAKKFRFITEHINGVVFSAGTNAVLAYVSPAAQNVFGFNPDEMKGKSLVAFLEEDIQRTDTLAAINKSCMNRLPSQILELQFRRKNGSRFWGELHIQYSADDGNPGIVGLLHDVTLRKRLQSQALFSANLFEAADTLSIEELLQAAMDELKRLTESSIGFCYFLRNDMRDTVLQVLSADSGKLSPLTHTGLFVEAIKAQKTLINNECDPVSGMPRNQQDSHSENRRTLVVPLIKDEVVTAIVGVGGKSSFYDEDDEQVVKFFADLAGDLVLRKRAEEIQKNDHASLIQAQKMAFLGSVINRMGSDYSNMLTRMVGLLNLILAQETINPLTGKHVMDSLEFVGSSRDMMSQLIMFAGSSGVMPIVLELNILVEEKESELRELIGENISLVLIPDRQKTLVKIDPSQFDNLLVALCLNARDAIAGKGCITIETSRITIDPEDCAAGHPCKVPGNYAVLSVADNGIGIENKHLPYIFEPLFSTRDDGQGMGLGLSIAYGIVKQNNGAIDCQTELGKGSTFTVFLPRFMGKNYFTQDDDSSLNDGLKETVLLVEDEPDILNFYKRMLEKSGYEVFAVATPDDAIILATEHQGEIDLLLTNVVLRDVNGCDLSQKLLSICPKLKTLFISDDHNDMTARYCSVDEGVGVIKKPFSMNDLTVKIKKLINPILVVP